MQKPMSYEKAMSVLDKIPNKTFKDKGVAFEIFITPADETDFLDYASYIRSPIIVIENETAIQFSSNGLFLLRQIHIEDTVVVHEIIKLNG